MFQERFCDLVTQNLNTDFTAQRMIYYLSHYSELPEGELWMRCLQSSVTGASSGLGFETTKELARKGAKVVMACRNPQKADTARKKIMNEIPDADLDVMILDLASQKSVADFADAFLEKYERLDTLVNNAGIMAAPYSETVDGFENHFATNYLGHFALTARLF